MAKKYLTLEEAAAQLSVSKDELIRLREQGKIRGFADRGNWKFKMEDVETLARQRQADSDPETPIYPGARPKSTPQTGSAASESGVIKMSDSSVLPGLSDSDVRLVTESGIISSGKTGSGIGKDSDSDVRIMGAPDSDSDVKLAEDDSDSDVQMVEDDSDSDVKMVGDDSDSDVRIVTEDDTDSDITLAPKASQKDSDSDVKLVGDDSGSDIALAPGPDEKTDSDIRLVGSDSDVRLVADVSRKGSDSDVEVVDSTGDKDTSDSDISLVRSGDSRVSVDFGGSGDSGSVVLTEESGIALSEDSSMTLAAESGISLEGPTDSGISLDLSDEEGITLAGDSGIALSPIDGELGKTSPMLDAKTQRPTSGTQFEIPSIMEDEGDFDFDVSSGEEDDTGVFALQGDRTDEQTAFVEALDDSGEFDDAAFDVDESGEFSEELELDADFEAGSGGDLDVFEEEGGEFEEGFTSGTSHGDFVAPVSRAAPVEVDWGTGTFVGLLVSTGLLVLVGVIMFDLIRSMWMWSEPTPLATMLLSAFRGLYGSGS